MQLLELLSQVMTPLWGASQGARDVVRQLKKRQRIVPETKNMKKRWKNMKTNLKIFENSWKISSFSKWIEEKVKTGHVRARWGFGLPQSAVWNSYSWATALGRNLQKFLNLLRVCLERFQTVRCFRQNTLRRRLLFRNVLNRFLDSLPTNREHIMLSLVHSFHSWYSHQQASGSDSYYGIQIFTTTWYIQCVYIYTYNSRSK